MPTTLYLAAFVAVISFATGWKVATWKEGHVVDVVKLQDAQADSAAKSASLKVLQDQLKTAQDTSRHNSQVIDELNGKNAQLVADRDRTHSLATSLARLLAAPPPPASAAGDHVPQAAGGPTAPDTGQTLSHEGLIGLLVSAHDECVSNADQLDALSVEITPQL